jgi:hypothetical protein
LPELADPAAASEPASQCELKWQRPVEKRERERKRKREKGRERETERKGERIRERESDQVPPPIETCICSYA